MPIPVFKALRAATLPALLLLPGAALAALGPQAGVTASVRGSVLLAEAGRPEAGTTAVNDGMEVFLGNAIRSGDGSGLQLMLLDQTSVTLGENAELAVDEFVYDPTSDVARLSVGITRGTFRLVTGAISDIDPANTVIRTPTAIIGVRGTILLTRVTPAGSLIALGGPGGETDTRDRVGAVEVTTPQGTVILSRPGFATFVAPGKAPEAPRPLTDEESASLNGDLSKKAGQGMNMAFATPAKGDVGGASRAAGASRIGSVTGRDPCDADSCQRRSQTNFNTPVNNTPSNNNSQPNGNTQPNNNIQPNNSEPSIDPALPWSSFDGGSEIANIATPGVGSFLNTTGAGELAGLSGVARYSATDIPIYGVSRPMVEGDVGAIVGIDRWSLFERLRNDQASYFGRYDFAATVDFDSRTVQARFYNGRLFDRISLTEIGTLSASLPDTGPLVVTRSGLAVPGTQALAYLGVRLLNSRELDPARVLEQSLVLLQGGTYYANNDRIYGTAPGWQAPNFDEFISTAAGAAAFSGVATYNQAGVQLLGKAGDGTFSVPSGQYDVAAEIDFDARQVRETISNMTLPGQAGTYELPQILHAIVTGAKLDYRDTGLAISDAASNAPVAGLSATVGTTFVTDWDEVYDQMQYLRHTLDITDGGLPALKGSTRIRGDLSGATYNE